MLNFTDPGMMQALARHDADGRPKDLLCLHRQAVITQRRIARWQALDVMWRRLGQVLRRGRAPRNGQVSDVAPTLATACAPE